jgi:hypothetical protein
MTMTPWTYKASTPTPDMPPPDCAMTRDEWLQLTPGYRREIWRGYERSIAK